MTLETEGLDVAEEPEIWSVSELSFVLKEVVESHFGRVWVAGEISNCTRAGSGHLYFTLKDDQSQIKAVMWRSSATRLKFEPRDGMAVIAAGPLEVYAPRGQYQLIADRMLPQGEGALEVALRQLQQKLEAEGLFAPERKRPLPTFPRRIALITSPTGAAIRDMLQVLTRRWPGVRVVVLPVPVQGDTAAPAIARALSVVGQLPDVDVVITGRGGGSLEDLWAFNEEVVVRAIAACPVPVVSAVGHEIDVTLADLVADRRALTPSEAGELVVPTADEVRGQLESWRGRLVQSLRERASRARLRLDHLAASRALAKPFDTVQQRGRLLDELEGRLRRVAWQRWKSAQGDLAAMSASLDALSPLAVLARGYSLTKRAGDGQLIRQPGELRVGDRISTLLATGVILSRVEEVIADEP